MLCLRCRMCVCAEHMKATTNTKDKCLHFDNDDMICEYLHQTILNWNILVYISS